MDEMLADVAEKDNPQTVAVEPREYDDQVLGIGA